MTLGDTQCSVCLLRLFFFSQANTSCLPVEPQGTLITGLSRITTLVISQTPNSLNNGFSMSNVISGDLQPKVPSQAFGTGHTQTPQETLVCHMLYRTFLHQPQTQAHPPGLGCTRNPGLLPAGLLPTPG